MTLALHALKFSCAYLAATGAAVVAVVVSVQDLLAGAYPWQLGVTLRVLSHVFLSAMILAAAAAALPSLLVGALAMRAATRARSALWYAATGLVVGWAAAVILGVAHSSYLVGIFDHLYLAARLFAAATAGGLFGGLMFWAVLNVGLSKPLGAEREGSTQC